MDGLVDGVSAGLVGEMMRLEIALVRIGPLSSTRTTRSADCPGFGLHSRHRGSKRATNLLLRLILLVCTMSWRVVGSQRTQCSDLLRLS